MSNYEALGFSLRGRDDAEALARAPLRGAEPRTLLLPGGPVLAYRLHLGGGLELWSYVRGRSIAAAFPNFRARTVREGVLTRFTRPASELAPRIGLQCGGELAFQLVNVLEVPAAGLIAGARAEVRLAALAGDGLGRAEAELGLAPPNGAAAVLAENVFRLTGAVLETELVSNPMTGAWVRWLRLDVGPWGPLETVGAAERLPEPVTAGDRLAGQITLRGAIVALPDADWRAESEES